MRIHRSLWLISLLFLPLCLLAVFLDLHRDLSDPEGDMYAALTPFAQPISFSVPLEDLLDLEVCWEIEDEREESETPLLTQMANGDQELGYDAETRTFYCPVDMTLEDWPSFAFRAAGAGLHMGWVDDYTYDEFQDAVQSGASYEFMVWNDDTYEYARMLFTGLPVLTLHVADRDGLDRTYQAARFTASAPYETSTSSTAEVHLRGGEFELEAVAKPSFKVRLLTQGSKDRYVKSYQSVLGLNPWCDWLLIANVEDLSQLRNHLGWLLWKAWNPDGGLTLLESKMTELFVDDEYMGIYELLEPIRAEEEVARWGNPDTDYSLSVIQPKSVDPRRITLDYMKTCGFMLEVRNATEHTSKQLVQKAVENLVALDTVSPNSPAYLDDKAFVELAESCIDIQDFTSYFLYFQVVSLPLLNNIDHNQYFWAFRQNGRYVYRISPWDLDFGFQKNEKTEEDGLNLRMPLLKRMLDLNVGGCRQILWDLWEEKRNSILTEPFLTELFEQEENRLNASGAYVRENRKWNSDDSELNFSDYLYFTITHLDTIEAWMEQCWPIQ